MHAPNAVLLCPQLVGRDAELTLVQHLLDNTGAALALIGEPGIGKTRLARECARQGLAREMRVGVGRARPGQQPYGAIGEALASAARTLDRKLPEVGAYQPQLGVLVPAWSTGTLPVDGSPLGLGEALLAAASDLGKPHGLLLIVEDLHWADEETVDLLEYVCDNASGCPVAIVLTCRPDSDVLVRRLRACATRGSLTYCELGRLDDATVTEMVAACLPGEDITALAHTVTEYAGGLPLLVEDLIASAVPTPAPAEVDAKRLSRFVDLVGAQLDSLDEATRQVVNAAAVLGHDFDWQLLPAMTGLTMDEVVGGLRRAGAGQLIADSGMGSYAFRHALTADAVRAALTPAAHAALARSAAESLSAGGESSDALLARLWSVAGESDRATASHRRAAATARSVGALATAESLLRAALEDTPDDHATQLQLLAVLGQRGTNDEVLARGADLVDRLPATERPVAQLLMARAAIGRGDPIQGRALLTDVRRAAREADAAQIAVLEAHAALLTVTPDRLVAAEHLAHRAAAVAVHEPDLLCEALELAGRCARVRDLSLAATAFEKALDVATERGLEVWRIRALNELGTVDMFRQVDATRLTAARDAAVNAGALGLEGATEVNLAAVFTMRGELNKARTAAERAEVIGRRHHDIPLTAAGLVFQGVVAAHQGRYGDMQGHVRAADSLAGDDPDVIVGTWAMCRGTAALLRDDHDTAHHALGTAAAKVADHPSLAISPVAGPWLLLRATRAEVSGPEVALFHAEQALGARWSQLWGLLAEAVVVARGGRLDDATDLVQQAIDAGQPMPLFSAIGLRLAAGVAARDGWGQPGEWLGQAASTFDLFGHTRPAAACRTLLRGTGARVSRQLDDRVPQRLRSRGVTHREFEVLELVAERLQNREIAARLFLSPRTVEKHVASLLTKTAAANRDELVRIALA